MFKNPGKALKTFALIMFWIVFIGGIIGAIAGELFEEPALLIVVAIASFVSAYLIALPLSAFGELVQNSTEIRDMLKAQACKPVQTPESIPVPTVPQDL